MKQQKTDTKYMSVSRSSLPFISVEASSVVRVDFVVAVIESSPEQMNTTQHTVLHKSCDVIFKLHIKNNNNQYLRYL